MPQRNLRVLLFDVTRRWLTRLTKTLSVMHQGFWLGVMDREGLNLVTARVYAESQRYLTREWNLSGTFPIETALIDRYFGGCRSVLIGAAGGGREVITLARRGFQIEAFECAKELVEVCQALLELEKIPARIVLSLPDRVPEGLGVYEGLLIGWTGYSHMVGRKTRLEFLAQFRQHSHPGAPILLSFFTRPSSSLEFRSIYRIANLIRRLRLGHREHVDLGDSLYDVFYHYFTQDEIKRELEEAGFEFVCYSDEANGGYAVGKAI